MAKPVLERNLIGKKIRVARLRARPRVSQEELAARLAVRGIYMDRSAIARMETQRRFIRDYEIIKIAACLGVKVSEFFAGLE
jgi:transcriptional regulator with XRE-family HTH domain